MKSIKSIPVLAAAALFVMAATACKGRTTENVEPNGDTIEVNPMQPTATDSVAADSMNHDAEAVTLPDAIEVPE